MKSLTEHLITSGLGYCCSAWFWRRFDDVAGDLVAARLGVSERTVQRHRKCFDAGGMKCQRSINCKEKA